VRIPRLGYLARGVLGQHLHAAFWEGLGELGYVDGRTIVVEARTANTDDELPGLAAELVGLKPDILVGTGDPAAHPLKRATDVIPIVAPALSDPVGEGLAASLARPGGNLTGVTLLAPDLGAKRLEILKETAPGVRRVGVLRNPDVPQSIAEWHQVRAAATALEIELQVLDVRRAEDFDRAFEAAEGGRVEALMTLVDALIAGQRARIAEFAARHRLPTVHYTSTLAREGGLLSYGVNHADVFRRAATYVDKVLKGARPAELPIEQPSTFELAVNLRTAQALGLAIPQSVLAQATEIIQ
jgi:putative ABC transport system substrate-binding protein